MENSYYAQYQTSAEAESVFAQVFGVRLTFSGFEPIAPRKWVKETGRGFKYFFYLNTANNGYSYLPWGALSLDFVPRFVAGKFKMQPKPKHAAIHYSFGQKTRWDWTIDKNRLDFRERVEKIAGESVPQITAWFQQFTCLNDIVAAIDQEKARSSRECDFYCYPVMVLAYSFLLARVHRAADARCEFEHVFDSTFYDPDVLPDLQKLFDAEMRASNP